MNVHRVAITVAVVVLIALRPAVSADTLQAVHPLFNGVDGISDPILTFRSAYGTTLTTQNPEGATGTCRYVDEYWRSGSPQDQANASKGRAVTIRTWSFDVAADALSHAVRPGTFGSTHFPGWEATPTVGDYSSWKGPHKVMFVKGSTLVVIWVNAKHLGRSYTEDLARRVAVRLP